VLAVYGIDANPVRIGQPVRRELFQNTRQKIALFLGRVHPKKGVDFLLRAWHAARLPEEWRLVIAGPAETGYVLGLERLADQLGIRRQIQFTGFVSGDDKAYLFQRANWFLLPSKQENFGIAVLEALSHGCPVAISDQVYLAESFRPESEVLPLELHHWRDFFQRRMVDDHWRLSVLTADRKHLLEKFDTRRVAQAWVDAIYRHLGTGTRAYV
jgi:glycosyltransferase involved in cell wall biosynthesis